MFFSQDKLELYVNEDGLAVKVKNYTYPDGKKPSLTQRKIISQLKKIGVRIDVDQGLLHQILAKAAAGDDIADMLVLKGIPPQSKGSDVLKLQGNPEFPVFSGVVIGTLEKCREDIPGKNVFNQDILPDPRQSPDSFKIGKGCVLDKNSNRVVARGYGQVILTFDEVRVKPLFRLSPDKIKITSVIFHQDFHDNPISAEMIVDSLSAMKINDTIDHDTLAGALKRAAKNKAPQICVVAKGSLPVNGKDGYFEPSQALKPPEINESDVTARIDFREQSIFKSVHEDTILGTIYPPMPGQNGYDVFGNALPAKDGKPASISAGTNVEVLSPDSTEKRKYVSADAEGGESTLTAQDIKSTAPGMVVIEGDRISVLDFTRINGDVDYSTGNIKLETGSVEITGSVREGFKVLSPNHIIINENVEEARIQAGGNVEVASGVIMKESGRIQCRGLFKCKFAENARIEAGGNIVFSSNLTNCRVVSRQSIIANGKGIVMGGELRAGLSIEVGQIGSDYEIQTRVYAGPTPKSIEKLIEEKKKMVKHHQEVKNILVQQATANKSQGLDQEQKNRTKELLKTYNTIQERIKKLSRAIQSKGVPGADYDKYFVKVNDLVYPGTSIHIGGKSLKVVETIQSPRFFFDSSRQIVSWK